MPPQPKAIAEEKVEYKVIETTSSTAENIENYLNDLAAVGWRVVTAIQSGTRIILERDA